MIRPRYGALVSASVIAAALLVSACGTEPSTASAGGDAPRASDTETTARAEPRRWIIEGPAADAGTKPAMTSEDPAPKEVAVSEATQRWTEQLLATLGSDWKAGRVYEVEAADGHAIRGATLRGPGATLRVSAQTLTEAMALLPPADEPRVERLGSYERRADGSELLVVDLHAYSGGGPNDYRMFFVEQDGAMFSFNYVDEASTPALDRAELEAFAISRGRGPLTG
jgi:hypothetical protein